MSSALIKWAVYRSLDTESGSRATSGRHTAFDVLDRWRRDKSSDEEIYEDVRNIYYLNSSQRQAGEPRVVLNHAYGKKSDKKEVRIPALWVDFDENDDHWYRSHQPSISGIAIVDVIRELLALDEPPPLPDRATSPCGPSRLV